MLAGVTPALGESGITAGEALFGNGTGAAMNEVQPTVQTTAAPQADASSDTQDSADQAYAGYPTLKVGDRDSDDSIAYVAMLQNRLIALGFLTGTADGAFGENTKTAVSQFQRMNGLEKTGVADAATQEKLYSDLSTLTTPSPDNPVVFGSDAVRVQKRLIEWGFLEGSADGKLGKDSQSAIKRFKTYIYENGMALVTPSPTPSPTPEPTATPDPNAMPMVNDMLLSTPEPESTPFNPNSEVDDMLLAYVDGEIAFDVYRITVQQGDDNADVRRVQSRLQQLGYLYPDPDGEFGANTALALKYFQRKHGLQETGVADESTQRRLYSSTCERAEEYVYPYKIIVDIATQQVGILAWDGSGFNTPVKLMKCSTGKDKTPTPTGTFQSYGRLSGEWFYFEEFNCYAKWAYGIIGDIFFHSVVYNSNKKLNQSSVNNLGRKASHGCIRLSVEDVKWIYDNCPYGTTVVIQ